MLDKEFENLEFIKECYCSKNSDVEQKIKEMRKKFPELTGVYEDDLETLFTSPLPLIEAVEVETRFEKKYRNYVAITKIPEEILPEVQKAIMRLGACLGGFQVEKWGVGYPYTEAIKKHLTEYMNSHSAKYVPGSEAGYPKVFEISRNEVAAADNECYSVNELIGIILS